MIERKNAKPWFKSSLPVHTVIHFILTFLCLVPFCALQAQWKDLLISPILAISHLVIDIGKLKVENRLSVDEIVPPSPFTKLSLFALDQLLHISSIVGLVFMFEPRTIVATQEFIIKLEKGQALNLSFPERVLAICIIGLCATVVSSVIVQILTNPTPSNTEYAIDKKITITETVNKEQPQPKERKTETSFAVEPEQKTPRGRLIGCIERLIVVLIVCMGAYTAIPFIVAAKSVARFKKFDHQEWAEYFLVGTLSSILCGTLSGLVLRVLLDVRS